MCWRSLGVAIYEKHAMASGVPLARDRDRGGGLAGAALLPCERDDHWPSL